MPLADNKRAQTIRNLWHLEVASKLLEADAVVVAIRAAITNHSLGGEFSTAEKNAMQDVETGLNTLASLTGVTAAAAKYVPTHRNQAIVIEGVNDG